MGKEFEGGIAVSLIGRKTPALVEVRQFRRRLEGNFP
jgi:hypothetical protein